LGFFHIFPIFSLFNLLFFRVFHIISLFNLSFFHNFHVFSTGSEVIFPRFFLTRVVVQNVPLLFVIRLTASDYSFRIRV
jgi:hypothetical protein